MAGCWRRRSSGNGAWRCPTPLRFVGGDTDLAYAVATYARDAPRALPGLPPPDAAELAQGGAVFVCSAESEACKAAAAAKAAELGGGRTLATTITRNFLGFPGKPQSYAITLVPPKR